MAWSFYDQNGKVLQGVLAVSIDTTELADDAVTAAKLASDAVVNLSVASGAAIAYAKLAALADGNILVGNGSNVAVSVNPSGDVDISNAGAFTIATDAVEGSMVHANVVDDTTLEQNGTQFRLKDNGVTLAKMAGGTDGNLITYDTSGDPAYVATGNDGQVLTSAGVDNPPAFETLVAGVGIGLVIALG